MSCVYLHCHVFLVPELFGSRGLSGLLPLPFEFSGLLPLPVEFYFPGSSRVPCLVVGSSHNHLVVIGCVPKAVRSEDVVGSIPIDVRSGDFLLD